MCDNPFEVLDITPCFSLSRQKLDCVYRAQQRRVHPDCFVGRSTVMKVAAQERSSRLSQAYCHLQDPLVRGEWILRLHHAWPVPQDPTILEEIMALRTNPEAIPTAVQGSYENLERHFAHGQWQKAAQEYGRFLYLARLKRGGHAAADSRAGP